MRYRIGTLLNLNWKMGHTSFRQHCQSDSKWQHIWLHVECEIFHCQIGPVSLGKIAQASLKGTGILLSILWHCITTYGICCLPEAGAGTS